MGIGHYAALAVLGAGILVGARSCAVIPAGHVGVKDIFGNVSEEVLQPGLRVKNPFAKIEKMSTQTQDYTMSVLPDEGEVKGRSDAVSALTKEGLPIGMDVTVLYRLDPDRASEIYKKVGKHYEDVIVRTNIREALRTNIAGSMFKDIYAATEGRKTFQDKTMSYLGEKVGSRGIIVEDVLLRHVEMPQRLSDAITEKLAAEQESQKMEFILAKERQEAERKGIEADGLATAQAKIAKSLTKEYLQYYYTTTLRDLVNSENTTFVVAPFDQGLIPMLNVK